MNNYTTITLPIAGREFTAEVEWRKCSEMYIGSDDEFDGILLCSVNVKTEGAWVYVGSLIDLIGDIIVEKIKEEGMK